jgi:integrase
VFRARGGQVLPVSNFRRHIWCPAVVAANLDGLRIHDLRHTAVALWIAAGASPKEVAARAGHTSVSFVLARYGHLFPRPTPRCVPGRMTCSVEGRNTDGTRPTRRRQRHPELDPLRVP